MSKSFLILVGILLIGMAIWGMISGKIIAGSRGLVSNFYTQKDNPFLFYSFIFIYIAIGAFILKNTL